MHGLGSTETGNRDDDQLQFTETSLVAFMRKTEFIQVE